VSIVRPTHAPFGIEHHSQLRRANVIRHFTRFILNVSPSTTQSTRRPASQLPADWIGDVAMKTAASNQQTRREPEINILIVQNHPASGRILARTMLYSATLHRTP
jgi:DNA-binding transcriptional regulator PaaX